MKTIKLLPVILTLLCSACLAAPPAGYSLAFASNFNQYLQHELSWGTGWGPIVAPVQWIEHTPYSGDFGYAYFTGPSEPNGDGTGKVPPNPFLSYYGELRITQYYDAVINHWRSGMISSVDTAGKGFSASPPCYWEARVYLPAGPNIWPGFVVNSVSGVFKNRTTDSVELDVFELYGAAMNKVQQYWHVWAPNGSQVTSGGGNYFAPGPLSNGWHTFGLLVTSSTTTWYVDGVATQSITTPAAALGPLYAYLDFALTGTTGAISPNYERIMYVKCWTN